MSQVAETAARLLEDLQPVRIARAEVIEVSLPLLEPFVTGFGVTETRRTILIRLVDDDGRVGWGEAAALDHPYYLPETTSTTLAVVVEYALPLALAASPCTPFQVANALLKIKGNTFARTGVESAFWCLESQRMETPLWQLLGGTRDRIPVGESIGIKATVEETLHEVDLRLQEGYRRIKLKIRPGWDVEIVRAVREAHGDIMLQVDANASYTLDQAPVLRELDAFGLACIEQPLAYDDLVGHASLQRQIQTPICLDECLRSAADVERALAIGACRNVNLKPGRVGGIAASLMIHDLCLDADVPLWCGGMLESGIGRAANIALSSLPSFTDPADMSPAPVLYREDLVDPTYEVDADGYIAEPLAAGLGYGVQEERVQAYTLRRIEINGDA